MVPRKKVVTTKRVKLSETLSYTGEKSEELPLLKENGGG